ncbi:MAG TPA: UvrD-helicase domain-containing protein, partial [Intrasporangiaceae bacterium]|nr:UvrD-helicase domain-containing protein [Intrasporangiaceae bacterium]
MPAGAPGTTPGGAGALPVPLTDFDITAPLPTGTVLLEASAGTGKTWTIAALVTRYVAEGVAPLQQMLIVTFGRAASQELRARVREQLVEAERALAAAIDGPADRSDPDDADPLLTLLTDAAPEQLQERHTRIRAALTHFDAATIATTHQFCHQVLRSLGVAGTTDAGAALVEDLDDLLLEVVDDIYLRGFIQDQQGPSFSRAEALEIARHAVNDIHAELRPTAAEPGSTPNRRARFAAAVREEMDIRKRRLQVMHYNDLLTGLARALQDPESPARTRMRQRWRVVLVDEFQDTDPIQWQVLDRAFSGAAHAMVLIGDPKQAIYAFRGGDVVTYLTAAQTATDRRTLPRNYRSDRPLVEALGVLLGGAELGDSQIRVHPVSAHREQWRLAGSSVNKPIRMRQVFQRDHLRGATAIGQIRRHIARDLAHDIAALLASDATFDGRPIQARDIAVLAHRGQDLLDAQAALQALGIPAVAGGGSSVLESRAARDWLALLEAMAAPHRPVLTRAAALTDLLGYAVRDLDLAAASRGAAGLDDELAGRCRDLAAIYTRQGVAGILEVLSAHGLAARVLRQVGGERSLTDLRHVAEVLHEVARRDNLGLVSLLTWLRTAMSEDLRGSTGTRTRRLDSDAAAVQLVTIHGSKGLQYPVVYLPMLTSRHVPKAPRVPLYHEPAPELTRCIDVGGDHPANPTWHEAVASWRSEEAGESLRLLYVAMTRAQSQVVTWWANSRNANAAPLHRILFGRTPGSTSGAVPDSFGTPADDTAATAVLKTWADAGAFALERADVAA